MSSVSTYYGLQSDIPVKSYFPGNSVFNFKRPNLLWTLLRYLNQMLWSFEFVWGFLFQFWASRYIMDLNWTFESKVMGVWICQGLLVQFQACQFQLHLLISLQLPLMSTKIFQELCILWNFFDGIEEGNIDFHPPESLKKIKMKLHFLYRNSLEGNGRGICFGTIIYWLWKLSATPQRDSIHIPLWTDN